MERNETIKSLLQAWNESNEGARRSIVSKTLADQFSYCDPTQTEVLVGKHTFLDFLTLFRRRMNGVTTSLDGEIDNHLCHSRFHYVMKEDGEVVSRGTYLADFTENGRIERLVGFKNKNGQNGG